MTISPSAAFETGDEWDFSADGCGEFTTEYASPHKSEQCMPAISESALLDARADHSLQTQRRNCSHHPLAYLGIQILSRRQHVGCGKENRFSDHDRDWNKM